MYYRSLPIQFSILLTCTLLSVPCFMLIFYHLYRTPGLRNSLHDHSILLIMSLCAIQTLTDVPISLARYYKGGEGLQSSPYCQLSYMLDYYLFTSCFLLLSWASIERHILIFHRHVFNNRLLRLALHYIPLGLCVIYPLCYYIVFIYFYPCENSYDFENGLCSVACYLWNSVFMAFYEQIAHGFALMLIIFVFNIMLIARVVRQRSRMARQDNHRKNRKMALQLVSVFAVFFLTNTGYFVIQLVRMVWNSSFGIEVSGWLFPLSMCMPPLMPIFYLFNVRNMRVYLKKINPWRRRAIVMTSQWMNPSIGLSVLTQKANV
jgi:hypothetical protein